MNLCQVTEVPMSCFLAGILIQLYCHIEQTSSMHIIRTKLTLHGRMLSLIITKNKTKMYEHKLYCVKISEFNIYNEL